MNIFYVRAQTGGRTDEYLYKNNLTRLTRMRPADLSTAIEVNFDLKFSLPEKNNMAALGYPIHLKGGGFTITLWIKYTNREGGLGTIFTAFQVP